VAAAWVGGTNVSVGVTGMGVSVFTYVEVGVTVTARVNTGVTELTVVWLGIKPGPGSIVAGRAGKNGSRNGSRELQAVKISSSNSKESFLSIVFSIILCLLGKMHLLCQVHFALAAFRGKSRLVRPDYVRRKCPT